MFRAVTTTGLGEDVATEQGVRERLAGRRTPPTAAVDDGSTLTLYYLSYWPSFQVINGRTKKLW